MWKSEKRVRRMTFRRWQFKMWLTCWYYELYNRVVEVFPCGNPHKRFSKLALALRRKNRRMWKFRVASNLKLASWLANKLDANFWDTAGNDKRNAIAYWGLDEETLTKFQDAGLGGKQ